MERVIIKTSLFIVPNVDGLYSEGKTHFKKTCPSKKLFQTFYKTSNRSVEWKREI